MELVCNSFVNVLEILGEITSLNEIILGKGVLCNFDLFILHNIYDNNDISVTKHKISKILLTYPTYNNNCLLEIIAENRDYNFTFPPDNIKSMIEEKSIRENEDEIFFDISDLIEFVKEKKATEMSICINYLNVVNKKYNSLCSSISELL